MRAAAEANAKRFDDAVVTQQRAIEEAAKTSIAEELTPLQARLAEYEQLQPYRQDRLVRRDPQRPRPN